MENKMNCAQKEISEILNIDSGVNASTPYGIRTLDSTPGFNGLTLDGKTGCYHLGNGYRLYSPTLKTFYSPDSLSPFDGAGVNRYQYCLLDPVNLIDPTGHLSWQAGLGVGLGLASVVLGVLAIPGAIGGIALGLWLGGGLALASAGVAIAGGAVQIASASYLDSDPDYAETLGWAALGLGIASAGLGVAGYAIWSRMASAAAAKYSTTLTFRNGSNYLGGVRFIGKKNAVFAHGYPGNSIAGYNGVGAMNGTKLHTLVANSGLVLDTGEFTLMTCFGGRGGMFSTGQLYANARGTVVKTAMNRTSVASAKETINVAFQPLAGSAKSISNAGGHALSSLTRAGVAQKFGMAQLAQPAIAGSRWAYS
ncbi:RHS repeat-associated core domain-containing protein [Pseudomonas sp. NPDC098747]|uniref:RHS repeat-associated core domain-containing protein n=1 Tax=Pseudomonas sp. NPDC098747 TaxID=3364487 RepID=UPI00383A352C